MTFIIPRSEMDDDDLRLCSEHAQSLVRLISATASGIVSGRVGGIHDEALAIECVTNLALELMERVHDALGDLQTPEGGDA